MGPARAGDEAESNFCLAEARGPVCHTDVAAQRELGAAAQAVAMDGGDEGLGKVGDGVVHAALSVDLFLLLWSACRELGDVRTGHEGLLPGAVEDDDRDAVVR